MMLFLGLVFELGGCHVENAHQFMATSEAVIDLILPWNTASFGESRVTDRSSPRDTYDRFWTIALT